MGGGLILGIILILIGASLIVKAVFHIDIPMVKVIIAFLFIFVGIKILVGNWDTHVFRSGPNDVILGQATFVHEHVVPKEQNIIFGHGTIDFRQVDINLLPAEIEINNVFGGCDILIKKELPVKIKIDAAFAGVSLPNENTTVFGSSFYQTSSFDETKPYLLIKANAVFSGLKIIVD